MQDDGFLILRTRLVKLLYLSDVFYYQAYGNTLTELDWIRYKYGPFAFELLPITKRMGLELGEEELDFSTGRGVRYEVYGLPNPDKWFDSGQRIYVDKVVRIWGGDDLDDLLDYVYCYTEPMKQARFRQRLDFSTIKRGMRYAETDKLDLSPDSIAEIKKLTEKQSPLSRSRTLARFAKARSDKVTDEPSTPKVSGKIRVEDASTVNVSRGENEWDY